MPAVLSRSKSLSRPDLIAPASGEIAEWALRLLERFGAAAEAGSEWRIEATTDLPDVEEVWRLLLADAPDLVAELALAAAAVDSLPKILASGPRPPDASLAAMTEHLLHASPASAASVGLLCDALQEIAANWPRGRPLRILELGAIGGGATRRVLDRLAQSGAAFSYLATSGDAEQSCSALVPGGVVRRGFRPPVVAAGWNGSAGSDRLRHNPGGKRLCAPAARRQRFRGSAEASRPQRRFCRGRARAEPALGHGIRPEPRMVAGWVAGERWIAAPLCRRVVGRTRCGGVPVCRCGIERLDAVAVRRIVGNALHPAKRLPGSDPGEPRSVLVVAGDAALAAVVHDRLGEAGHRVTLAGQADAFADGLQDRSGSDALPPTILFMADGSCPGDPTELASQQIAALARAGDTGRRPPLGALGHHL